MWEDIQERCWMKTQDTNTVIPVTGRLKCETSLGYLLRPCLKKWEGCREVTQCIRYLRYRVRTRVWVPSSHMETRQVWQLS